MSGIPDREALIHNVEAFRAARAWAVVHRHQLPDDRMLKEYGAKIVQSAYQAGREDAARPALLAEVLYRYIDRVRERRAYSIQGQYHPEFYKGMKHAADLIAAGGLDAEIESRAAIKAEIARGEGKRAGREDAAQALEAQSLNYPEDVFPPTSDSRDAIGGTAMRHAYRIAAKIARCEDQDTPEGSDG